MIWFRRIIAISLALFFIILFIVLLVVHHTNATAGNPDFYTDQLQQADIYNFAYNDILPAALEEMEIEDDTSDFPVDVALLKSRVPGMIEEALPPEWLQAQMEQAFDQILPYAVGDTANFSVTITLQERVEAAVGAVKNTLHDEEFFNDLYEQGIDFAVDKYEEMQEDLPSFLVLSDDEVASKLRTILPPEWILTQVDAALDEILPYFNKDKEHFLLKLDISERTYALEDAVTDIMMKPAAYDYFSDNLTVSYIQDNMEEVIELPVEVDFVESEVIAALQEVFTFEWYQEQVNDIVGQVFAYLRGEQETIDIVIPLADLKPAMIAALADLADQKLEDIFNSLPEGTGEQTAEFLANPTFESLPEYRPAGITYAEVKLLAGIDIESLTSDAVNEWLPDDFTFSDADIRETFTENGEDDVLTQARDLVRDGLTFTDEDLRENLGDDFENIEDARDWIATDFTFTEEDLHEYLTEDEGGNADEEWQSYQDVRSIIGTARTWLWAAWLIPAMLLVGIGFLGGRNWRSRVIWAASVLAIASLIVYIAFGPVFSAVAQPRIDDAFVEAVGQTEGVQAMAAEKGVEMGQNAIDSFVGGINIQAIVLLVVSLVAIAVVIWRPWRYWRKSIEETVPPDEMPLPEEPQDLTDEPQDLPDEPID
jgi:hypothetical protein